jgi:hypothetical protein
VETPLEKNVLWNFSRRYVWDIVFVVLLPVLCFTFDPILFGNVLEGKPMFSEAIQIATYVCVAILILMFFVSFININSRILKLLTTGALLSGTIVASSIGVLLFPLTIIGLIIILGLLGFGPFFTASRFWKRYEEFKLREIMQPDDMAFIFLGFLIPFVPSILIYIQGTNVRSQIMADITSQDGIRIHSAMNQINHSIYCTKYCTVDVIESFEAGKIKLPEVEFSSLLMNASGINYRQFVEARISN